MKPVFCFVFIFQILHSVFAQTDNVGSGRAIQFDGIDDLIDLGDTYHDVNLPFSVSAWLYIDPVVNYAVPIFVTNDNNPIYRGFWFFISNNLIWCEFGDGAGGSNPAFRRGKQAAISNVTGRWIHVTAVMRAPFDISLYINGIDVGGQSMGSSNLTMKSSFSGDHPKIGYFLSNDVVYRYKGIMDEIRLWNRALTPIEIRDAMCKTLVGNETGLIGYWNFNELNGTTAFDKSSRAHHGTFVGNPTRVFSGAPIGETSIQEYRSNWANISKEIIKGEDKLMVSGIESNPEGIHLYTISSNPSQTNGLGSANINNPYFGVFLASLDNNNTFDVSYFFQNNLICNAYQRMDNSVSSWTNKPIPIIDVLQRAEFVKFPGSAILLDLGSDLAVCNSVSKTLDTKITDSQVSFLWSTGETSSSINVSQPGKYWVKVENSCGVVSDTIRVNLKTSPPPFSFGENQEVCEFEPTLLKPYANSSGYEFTWQDKSTNDSFLAKEFGTYSVTIKNICGEATGIITFSPTIHDLAELSNVITPNGDTYNEYFVVGEKGFDYGRINLLVINRWGKQVYFSDNYKNDWNGGELSGGVYFYTIYGKCINKIKGSLSIVK